jgi:hypothetical protein
MTDGTMADRTPLLQTSSMPTKLHPAPATAVTRARLDGRSEMDGDGGGVGTSDSGGHRGHMVNNNLLSANVTKGTAAAAAAAAAAGGVESRSAGVGGRMRAPTASPTIKQVLERTTEGILKAARLGDLKMLSELHAAGYSLLSIDETGKTALHYGARFGHKEVVKFLIEHAPPCILDLADNEKGQTALHKAAAYKRRTICCYLVAAGASLLVADSSGQLPRQLASTADDADLASYLESQEQFQREKAEGIHLEEGAETPV